MPDRLAAAREPRRPVGQIAQVLLLADRETEVRPLVEAVAALAALRREQRHDVVARRDRRHACSHGLDDAGALVAEHRRRVPRRVGAGRRVEIRVADPACDEPDEHFACLRLGELHVLDREWCPELLENCGLDAHPPIIVENEWPRSARSPRCATPQTTSRISSHRRTTSSPRAARADYLARSPYNVVHLTLPDSEEQAARDLAAWRSRRPRRGSGAGVLVARAALRRAGRDRADTRGIRRRAARRAVRGSRRSSARAHACRSEGRPATPAASDAHAARADLLALGRDDRGRRARRARARRGGGRRRLRSSGGSTPSSAQR